jgi:hypothetical protein
VLVVGEDHERLFTLGAGTECLVDLLDEHLTLVDIVGGVVYPQSQAPFSIFSFCFWGCTRFFPKMIEKC